MKQKKINQRLFCGDPADEKMSQIGACFSALNGQDSHKINSCCVSSAVQKMSKGENRNLISVIENIWKKKGRY